MMVIHIIPGDLWAGAEAQVFYTLREIRRQSNHRISIILFNKGELFERLVVEGFKVHVIDESLYNSMSICKGIKDLLLTEQPEIVHVHEYKSHILAIAAKLLGRTDWKIVRTFHGSTNVPLMPKYIKSQIIFKLEKIALRYFTCAIVAVSRELARLLREEYRRVDIYEISNGIDTDQVVKETPEVIRKRFGISEKIFWIGTAARIEKVKNVEMLLEAARIWDKGGGDITYCISIFGDGSLKDGIQREIISGGLENRVFLHGHHRDMLTIMNAFDVFVLTSENEGLPISLVEAMFVGTIPVCTRVGGIKQVIEDGKDGFLIDSNNARQLAEVLLFICRNRNDMAAIRRNATAKVVKSYSAKRCAEEVLEVYKTVVGSERSLRK